MNLKIGVLCSGNLGLDSLHALSKYFKPQFVFTDKNSEEIIELSEKHSIPVFVGNPRKNESTRFLEPFHTDVIFSINYLFIVGNNILRHPELYAINLHGSLLPKYRGRSPHVWAIINGEKETGVTAHIMEEGCDTGDIVLQKHLKITTNDTGASILTKYKEIYPKIIIELIEQVNRGSLKRQKQDDRLATYFGKRSPEDGEINWNWQKERIRNWIRAQAYPYPGAFSYINQHKIIIDEVRFSDYGFNEDMANGLILKTEPYISLKTPNGVIELTKIRNDQIPSVRINDKLNSQCI
ncbi:MAG: methionyl-tRNA formyltransferase [bacterium]